jgi:hypothetical protein
VEEEKMGRSEKGEAEWEGREWDGSERRGNGVGVRGGGMGWE